MNPDVVFALVDAVKSLSDLCRYTSIRQVLYDFRTKRDQHQRLSLWTLGQVNRNFREAVQKVLWFELKLVTFGDIDDVLELLTITPHVVGYVRFLSFELRWNGQIDFPFRSKAGPAWYKKWCPDHLLWAYADREKIQKEYEAIRSKELGFTWKSPYWEGTLGPMGDDQSDSVLRRHRDAASSMKIIEELITKVPSITIFNYRSMFLPLTLRACQYLRDCESLEIIVLGTQGELDTLKYPMSPLNVIFTGRKRTLKVVGLSLQLSPSDSNGVEDCDLKEYEGDLRHKSVLDKVEVEPVDDGRPIYAVQSDWVANPQAVIMPDLDSHLASTSMQGVPFYDRPMVMVIRSLIAAQDSIELLALSSTCRWLCRMPQIIWLWLKLQVSDRYWQGREPFTWDGEPWVQAARALRPTCEALARRLARPDSRLLPADVPTLAEMSPVLEIYREYLLDAELQRKICDTWGEVIRTGHKWKRNDLRPIETPITLPLHLIRADIRADYLIKVLSPSSGDKCQLDN